MVIYLYFVLLFVYLYSLCKKIQILLDIPIGWKFTYGLNFEHEQGESVGHSPGAPFIRDVKKISRLAAPLLLLILRSPLPHFQSHLVLLIEIWVYCMISYLADRRQYVLADD